MPDPLESLRLAATPEAPRREFAAALRGRMEAALGLWPPDPSSTRTRSTTMSTTEATTTQTVMPYLCVTDSVSALAFYGAAFGAVETFRVVGDDGRMGHCEFTMAGSRFMMADEFPEIGVISPQTLGNSPVMLYLEVPDVDAAHGAAVDAGATSLQAPETQTHGARTSTIVDPFGHRWMLAQTIEELTLGEYEAREGASGEWTVTPNAAAWSDEPSAPVELGYVTMPTAAVDRSTAFFSQLFGWQFEPGAQGDGNAHIANTRLPMGMSEQAEGTSLYFRVDDIEPYAAKIEALGGQVLSRNQYESGGNAECVDDQGFRFDLFQPAPGY